MNILKQEKLNNVNAHHEMKALGNDGFDQKLSGYAVNPKRWEHERSSYVLPEKPVELVS